MRRKNFSYLEAVGLGLVVWFGLTFLLSMPIFIATLVFPERLSFLKNYSLLLEFIVYGLSYYLLAKDADGAISRIWQFKSFRHRFLTISIISFVLLSSIFSHFSNI